MRKMRDSNAASLTEAEIAQYSEIYKQMVVAAAHGRHPIVWGKAMGPSPRFFVIGEEPTLPDYFTGRPFSGSLSTMLVNVVESLREKYDATMNDMYVTYFVKTTFQVHELDEKKFMDEWLPTVQMEYALSGCEMVIPMGKVMRQVVHLIPQKPLIMQPGKPGPTLPQRIKSAWRILSQ